jgi:hypothetical protein
MEEVSMKRWFVSAASLMALALPTVAAAADIITLDIRAFVDGRDLLIIRGNTLQWDHRDFAAVGRIKMADGSGRNDPTVISTSLNGVAVLADYNWYPEWPEPVPAEIRYPAYSSVFSLLSPDFPLLDYAPSLHVVSARDRLSVNVLPSAANGYAFILDFNDNPSGGAAWYEARITVGGDVVPPPTVPEPGTWAMLVTGLGGIGMASRRSARQRIGIAAG